jgi:DMSO/TMAO reductase YedYZ molybdopterin-dependent catalytic subunit
MHRGTDDRLGRPSRRAFLRGASGVAVATTAGLPVVFADRLPSGLALLGLGGDQDPKPIPGKDGLRVFNDRPVLAETPAHLLDDDVTPASRLFVRNNGLPPVLDQVDADAWEIEIAGEAVSQARTFTVGELRDRFERVSLPLVLECAGNGRAEFQPPAAGTPWTTGAVGCPRWDGIRLRDLLDACDVSARAVYVAYESADRHLSGDPARQAISRGVPIEKARQPESLLAFGMNGGAIPDLHGHPARLVFGGWPGSTSGKWVKRILVRDRVHDGAKMGGASYRKPRQPVRPGAEVPDADMEILGAMPIKSLITAPRSGAVHRASAPLSVRGHAWVGDRAVAEVFTSIDFGTTWQRAELAPAPNRNAWQSFGAEVTFLQPGYYEIWARAVDDAGRSQPMVLPGWNPKGYMNNACHRIAVQVEV